MNKVICALTASLLFAVGSAYAHLHNPSFETADKAPTKAEHWGVWGEKLERVTDWSPQLDGTAMVAYKHWELSGNHSDSSGLFQDAHNIEAGETYEFTLAGFADAPEWGSLDGRLEIRLEATVDGKQVHLARETVSFDAFLGAWHSISVKAKTPVDNLRAVVELYPAASASKGGALKMDLTSLTKIN